MFSFSLFKVVVLNRMARSNLLIAWSSYHQNSGLQRQPRYEATRPYLRARDLPLYFACTPIWLGFEPHKYFTVKSSLIIKIDKTDGPEWNIRLEITQTFMQYVLNSKKALNERSAWIHLRNNCMHNIDEIEP